MSQELRREGFARMDWESSVELEHKAGRDESDLICNKSAYVYWRADAERRLTAIRGDYPFGGCL